MRVELDTPIGIRKCTEVDEIKWCKAATIIPTSPQTIWG